MTLQKKWSCCYYILLKNIFKNEKAFLFYLYTARNLKINYTTKRNNFNDCSQNLLNIFFVFFLIFIFYSRRDQKNKTKLEFIFFKTNGTEIYVIFSCPLGIISRMLSIITDTTPNLAGKIFLRITQKKKKIKQPRISWNGNLYYQKIIAPLCLYMLLICLL